MNNVMRVILSFFFIISYTNAEDELCKIEDRDDELCVAKSSVRSVGSMYYSFLSLFRII